MSAWASGNLAEKLKQQKLTALNGKVADPSPAAATTSNTANPNINTNTNKNNEIVSPTPLCPPPAVDETATSAQKQKPVSSPASGKPQQQQKEQLKQKDKEQQKKEPIQPHPKPPLPQDMLPHVRLGPLSLPDDIAKLMSVEFKFLGTVKKVPQPVEETRYPDAPTTQAPIKQTSTFVPRHSLQEAQRMSEASPVFPMHHHHHHHHPPPPPQQQYHLNQQPQQPQQQPRQYSQHQNQNQHQQRYMQHGMTGQTYHDAYNPLPYNMSHMSPYAAPYHPRMYDRYPGMSFGMYGNMGEYSGFSLQGRPAYYPPPQNQMGPYNQHNSQ